MMPQVMNQASLSWITNYSWGIADDVLRDLHVRGTYRGVAVPLTPSRCATFALFLISSGTAMAVLQ